MTRADVRDVLMRREISNTFNHNYSVKIGQVQAVNLELYFIC